MQPGNIRGAESHYGLARVMAMERPYSVIHMGPYAAVVREPPSILAKFEDPTKVVHATRYCVGCPCHHNIYLFSLVAVRSNLLA
jgi:hypothetical protein